MDTLLLLNQDRIDGNNYGYFHITIIIIIIIIIILFEAGFFFPLQKTVVLRKS